MIEKLKAEIHDNYSKFSRGIKKVAQHFLANPESFATNSAGQIGNEIKVSETTVFRFCYALGYSGFSTFQKDIQYQLLNNQSSLFEFHSMKNELVGDENLSKRMMLRDSEMIAQTAERLNLDDYERAVEQLAKANRILVSGIRSSHAMAHWFSFTLELIRGNVRLFRPDMDDLIIRIRELEETSVFVAFSFHRYALETLNMVKEAKRLGAFIIGISDSEVSPIAEYADILFTVQLPKKSTLDVAPAVFSLMNALVAGVSLKNSEQFQRRMELYEELHFQNFFVE